MSPSRNLIVTAATLCALAIAGIALLVVNAWKVRKAAEMNLLQRLSDIVEVSPSDTVPCSDVASRDAVVILALGQSSAGNHGARTVAGARIAMLTDHGCVWAADPLPGGTGRGGSTWSRLPAALAAFPELPAVLMSVLAVESSDIGEWTAPSSPLRERLLRHLERMKELGRPPAFVLWDQGAADVRRKTSARNYRAGLSALADLVQSRVGSARILLAPTTVCRSAPATELHEVVRQAVEADSRFELGPLLDQVLAPSDRVDGCHFSEAGLSRAAESWALALRPLMLQRK